jgi:SAM-dependent methyltransferase
VRSTRGIAAAPVAGSPSARETIDCYDLLAAEYDSADHGTTRELERLSGLALGDSLLFKKMRQDPVVLELGSGTGALSCRITREQRGGCLLLSDPAPRMLRRATRAAATEDAAITTTSLCGSAEEILARLMSPPDAILGGLSDPYLSEALLKSLLGTCAPDTLVFFSVPSRRWARVEREQRLGVPLDRTRFRTNSGRTLFSRSLALDPNDLASLFRTSGIDVLEHGSKRSEDSDLHSPPEVSWVLGRPLLAAALD